MLISARHRAKRDGRSFSLTQADVRIPDYCPALGIPLFQKEGKGGGPNSPSLDRIDSAKGYEPGNVVVVSWRANSIKKDSTPAELRRIAAFYEQLSKE